MNGSSYPFILAAIPRRQDKMTVVFGLSTPPNVGNNFDNGSHAAMIGIELAEKRSKIDNDTKAKQYKF